MSYCKIHGKNCNGECKDPNIDNGMMTKVWGPPGWLFLHCITYGYPYIIDNENNKHREKREQFKKFFHYLGYVLPCKYCRNSYNDFMEEIPVDNALNSREELTKWFYNMHNKVNIKLGVPDCEIPKYEEMDKIYESLRAKCAKTTEEERINNKAKGCVNPANGTPRRSLLKIIKCNRGDVTRMGNNGAYKKEDYLFFKKKNVIYVVISMIIVVFIIWFKKEIYDYLKKF